MASSLVYDPTEVALGISNYLREDVEGFSAVSKARFSDFVVHEVGIDGKIARLESAQPVLLSSESGQDIASPAPSQSTGTGEAEDNPKKRKAEEVELVKPEWSLLQTELSALVEATAAAKVIEFLQSIETANGPSTESSKDASTTKTTSEMNEATVVKFVKLPPVQEKDQRRALHQWIKSRLSFCAVADTVDGENAIRIWHISFARFMPNAFDNHRQNNNNGRQSRGIPNAPRNMPYLKFVLYKENMDSGAAMQQISNRAANFGGNRGGGGRGGSGRHGGRGGRDRGGRDQHNTRVRLGYAGNKDKRGIASQFITIPARDTSIKHLCNVFNGNNNDSRNHHHNNRGGGGGHTQSAGVGLMRVGNFEYCADQLQLGRLNGNRFDVALRNVTLSQPLSDTVSGTSTSDTSQDAKILLQEAATAIQASGFINYFGLQRFGKYHDTHLTGMAVLRGDYQAAVDKILEPKDGERVDVNAARQQWRDRFQDVADDSETDRAAIEKKVAEKVLRSMNNYMHSENAILNSIVRHPLDYKRAFSCIVKTMRMMFIHALQSFVWNKAASFRIATLGQSIVAGDLVLAESNSAAGNRDGCPDVKVVTDDDIANQRYSIEDVVLPLIGAKTRNPENVSGDIFDTVLQENNVTRQMIDQLNDQDFHCAGDYRKLICRPTDVDFEIVEYRNELQPLLQTDFMKLNGIDVEHRSPNHSTAKNDAERPLLAMVVGFSLPSSSYATVFLRELMKRPTSSEYQRELKLGGEVEATKTDTPDEAAVNLAESEC